MLGPRRGLPTQMMSLRPVASRAAAKLLGRPELEAQARETVVLAPSDVAETGTAIALPGEFDRVETILDVPHIDPAATREDTLWKRWLEPGPVDHLPTMAYRLDDAILSPSSIYAGRAFRDYGAARALMLRGPAETIDEAYFCGGSGGANWFGHWLCDDLATEILAEERGLPALALAATHYQHEAGYRELFDLHAGKPALARVRSLWLIDDRGYNQDHVRRFRKQRDRLRRRVAPAGDHRFVYLARGSTGTRRAVANEAALMDRLVADGFIVVEPEKMAPRDIAAALVGARLIVTMEGSALDHGLVSLPEGAAVLALMPPERFNIYNKIRCELAGLRFAYLVGDRRPDGTFVDPDRVFRTMAIIPDL